MKLKQFFSKSSRIIHRWIGLYFATTVIIYMIEAFILPVIFSANLPNIDGKSPLADISENMSVSLSLEEAKKLFFQQHPSGISLPSEIDEITYLPENSVYRFANTKRFFEWYTDAHTGKIIKYGFKVNMFLEEKSLFGWFRPWIHDLLELPILLLIVILSVTGVYLFITPFLKKKLPQEPNKTQKLEEKFEIACED